MPLYNIPTQSPDLGLRELRQLGHIVTLCDQHLAKLESVSPSQSLELGNLELLAVWRLREEVLASLDKRDLLRHRSPPFAYAQPRMNFFAPGSN